MHANAAHRAYTHAHITSPGVYLRIVHPHPTHPSNLSSPLSFSICVYITRICVRAAAALTALPIRILLVLRINLLSCRVSFEVHRILPLPPRSLHRKRDICAHYNTSTVRQSTPTVFPFPILCTAADHDWRVWPVAHVSFPINVLCEITSGRTTLHTVGQRYDIVNTTTWFQWEGIVCSSELWWWGDLWGEWADGGTSQSYVSEPFKLKSFFFFFNCIFYSIVNFFSLVPHLA